MTLIGPAPDWFADLLFDSLGVPPGLNLLVALGVVAFTGTLAGSVLPKTDWLMIPPLLSWWLAVFGFLFIAGFAYTLGIYCWIPGAFLVGISTGPNFRSLLARQFRFLRGAGEPRAGEFAGH